jgi:hypothetical protein
MSEEQADITKLIDLLTLVGKTEAEIITTLEDIIKSQMMYGGTLKDKIDYIHATVKRDGLRSGAI